MAKIGSRDVRTNFSEILHQAAYGKERIVVTKNGKDVAAMIPIEDLRLLEQLEDEIDVREAKKRLRNPKLRPWNEVRSELERGSAKPATSRSRKSA